MSVLPGSVDAYGYEYLHAIALKTLEANGWGYCSDFCDMIVNQLTQG